MNQNLLQLGRQLQAIWKQLGLNQRLSVIAAALVVIGGLIGLAVWSGRVDYSLLYAKLDDSEASKVITALDEEKVPYTVGRGGGSIYVPNDQVYSVRMKLAGRGIPKGEGVGFEIFDKPNFGISDFVQRANYLRAVQGELARTISQLNEIEAARVMIVMPENRLLIDSKKQPTASVFVRVRGNTPLQSQAVNSIRFLVANAVEGLKAHNVTVVDNQGNVLSENTEPDSIAGLSAGQLAIRRNLEQYLSKKAEGMLEKVLGAGQAVVRVAVEVNLDTVTRVEEKFDPEGQVARTTTSTEETTESASANPATVGVPGMGSNSVPETNTIASATPLNNSKQSKKVTNTQYDINRVTSNVVQGAGGLKRVTAAVFVAQRVEGTGADRKAVTRSPEDILKLKRIVESALGIPSTGEGSSIGEVTLEEMPFNDQPAIELTNQLDQQQRREMWWNVGKNLIYPALALGILFLFWRTFKRTPADGIPIGVPLGHANGNGNGNGHASFGDWNGRQQPGIVTVDTLNQLIRENPDNMTQAIRGWINRNKSNPK